jgi:hypothetical protein
VRAGRREAVERSEMMRHRCCVLRAPDARCAALCALWQKGNGRNGPQR